MSKNIFSVELLFMLSFIVLVGLNVVVLYNNYFALESFKRQKMVDTDFITEGFYNLEDDYFCVWTEGRDEDDIVSTVEHEKCHFLIDNDRKGHFCGVVSFEYEE